MRKFNKLSFFSKIKPSEYIIQNLSGKLNTAVADLDINDTELSDGQNIISASDTSLKKRGGITLFGPFLGANPITGGFNFISLTNGVQRQLVCYNTGVNIHTATTSTPIAGITLTQGSICDGVYFAANDSFYITNGIDQVAKVANDGTGSQTGIALPNTTQLRPKYINTLQDRLILANTPTNPNRVYYTDILLDTFSNATQWFDVPTGPITGMVDYYGTLLIFTKRQIYSLSNFAFDSVTQENWAASILTLPTDFGSIIEGTIKVCNRYIYFLGQDMNDIAAIYVCDGYNASNITDTTIKATMQGLSRAELLNAVAIADGSIYRLHVAESGQGTNNIAITYDTIKSKFYPPERRWIAGIADASCLWSSENQGVWEVYMGTQINGQVYQLHANDGLYDELGEESYLQAVTANLPIEYVGSINKVAQGFKLHKYQSMDTVNLTRVAVQAQLTSGSDNGIVVSIVTDNNNSPTGTTLGTTTINPTLNSYAWFNADFSTPIPLLGNTLYWIVLQTPASTFSADYYIASGTSNTYPYANLSLFTNTAWTNQVGQSITFVAFCESPIDAYADSKNFLIVNGKEFKLIKFETIISTVGKYFVEIGFQQFNRSSSYTTFLVDLSGAGVAAKWGDGIAKWGDGVTIWGGVPSRNYTWTDIGAFESRGIKLRIRNRNANEQFEFNKIILELLPRFRNT